MVRQAEEAEKTVIVEPPMENRPSPQICLCHEVGGSRTVGSEAKPLRVSLGHSLALGLLTLRSPRGSAQDKEAASRG